MQTGITAIYEVDDLGTTPARVNRKTGELYINMKKWRDLSPEARLFVLLHEAGHVDQDTRNELLADNYAFYAYARAGKPLSKSITALTRLLHFNNPQHFDRLRAQMHRAFAYDYKVNGNLDANPEDMENALFNVVENDHGYNNFLPPFLPIPPFFIPKKARQKMKKAFQARFKPKSKQEARKTDTAPQLKASPIAGEIPAPKLKETAALSEGAQTPTSGTNSKKGLYVAGILLVLVIGTVIYFIKRKKS